MRVLVIGGGGREHALAWKIGQSKRLDKLYVAPGNAGTEKIAQNVALDITDHKAILAFCDRAKINFVVVGPDAEVVAGLGDEVRAAGIACFAPSKEAARLEGSKGFTKALCVEMNIPTAGYKRFEAVAPALAYVAEHGAPIVVKADGLAAGKGVTVAMTIAEAEAAVRALFEGALGAAVVIEDFLEGEEASLFALSDGENFVLLESAQDHKRAFDGDTGPNTGGMGAYSPAPVMTPEMLARARDEIIAPTIAGMAARGTPFRGVLYAGLMITPTGPSLIEYNVRFGDPECQVLMMRLKSDLLDLLEASACGSVAGVVPEWRREVALTIVLATRGYPDAYGTGSVIGGAEALDTDKVQVFHGATARKGDALVASGGRVLNVSALGGDVAEARARAYGALKKIAWPEASWRRDIGWRAIGRARP